MPPRPHPRKPRSIAFRDGVSGLLTMASVLFGGLWLLTAFGGWAAIAFCGTEVARAAPHCSSRVALAAGLTTVPAAAASLLTLAAWLVPGTRRRPELRNRLLAAALTVWATTEALLFLAGETAG